MLSKTSTLVCVVLGAMLSTARADTETPPGASDGPEAYRLTLPHGRVLLDAFAEINLSDGVAFKPISISPDVWYGATDDLTVGLVHSSVGATGFIGGVGDALCLSGKANGCDSLYPGAGIDVRYQMKPNKVAWALDGGLYINDFDPLQLAVKLGAMARWASGQLAVELAPSVFIGVTNREPALTNPGALNQETVFIPATALYTVAPKIAVALQLGFVLPIEDIGNTYAIPLSIGAHYDVNESATVNLAFSLPLLITGLPAGGGLDARSLTLGGTYAF
jgi:hypothetical protein